MRSVVYSALLASLVCACGLGTEIGNGFKPDGSTDERKGSGTPAKEEGAEVPVSDDSAAPGGASNQDKGDEVGADDPTFDPPFDFDFDVLVAPCASPFGDDIQSPVRLADAGGRNVVAGELVSGEWRVGSETEVLRVVTPAPGGTASEVSTKDVNGTLIGVDLQCLGYAVDPAATADGLPGTYQRITVTVARGTLATEVSWYLEGTAPFKLARVTLDDADGEDDPLILDAE